MINLRTLAGSTALVLAAAPALAAHYTFSTFLGPNHPITLNLHVPWAEDVAERTDGEIDFEVYVGGAILPGNGVLQGVAQNVAQGGFITAGYVPAEMPVWNVIGDVAWEASSDYAVTLAATEFGLLNQLGHDEWTGNGVVFTGSASTVMYSYLCRGEPKSLEDFEGLRIRTAGNGWARFAESIGAVPVNVSYTETYSALERGAIECTNLDPTHLYNGAQVAEVVDSVVMLPMGPFFSQAAWAFNQSFWNDLSAEQRRIIFEESARSLVRLHDAQDKMLEDNLAQARENGLAVIEPAEDLVAAKDAFVADGIGGLAKIAENRGVANYQQAIDEFSALLTKWDGLLAENDRDDPEAMYDLIMTELYDKLDPETYGVE